MKNSGWVVSAFLLGTSGFFGTVSLGAAPPVPVGDLEKDPYVQLYVRRVEMTHALLEEYKAQEKYEQARFRIVTKLKQANATTEEEYQERLAALLVARARVDRGGKKILEMEALLGVCRFLRENGREMPIFPVQDL